MVRVQSISRRPQFNIFSLDTVPLRGFQNITGKFYRYIFKTELGRRQCFSFATMTTRQHKRASGTRKIRKILWSRCLHTVDWVDTTNIVKMVNPTTLRPENMVTLSRQCCRVPSSDESISKFHQVSCSNLFFWRCWTWTAAAVSRTAD